MWSTTSALLPITQKLAAGFNQNKPPLQTVTKAIDLSKIIDTVNHTKLKESISAIALHSNIILRLSAYLRSRFASCRCRTATLTCHEVRAGVHQGSVISLLLFITFVSDYPSNCKLQFSYADDSKAAESFTNINIAADVSTTHVEAMGAWAKLRGFEISAPKSSVTVFTPYTHQTHRYPPVTICGTPLPLERHPKLLGVTFDPHFTFHIYARVLKEQTAKRLKIFKALTGIDWGQQKETTIKTYKPLIL